MGDSLNRGPKRNALIRTATVRWLNALSRVYGYDAANSNSKELFDDATVRTVFVAVPQQPNLIDCGCFLLRTVLQFGLDEGLERFARDGDGDGEAQMRMSYAVEEGLAMRKCLLDILQRLEETQRHSVQQMIRRLAMRTKSRQ